VASLVNTFLQAFLEVLHHSLQHVGGIAATSFLMFCIKSTFVLGFFSYTLLLHLGTFVPMNIEVPTKYPLTSQDRIVVFENRLHSENPILYRPALHGN
jgi:hypothetical protein